jgi:membrane-anchored protein YejM (alkaline phosphatase superfamily)
MIFWVSRAAVAKKYFYVFCLFWFSLIHFANRLEKNLLSIATENKAMAADLNFLLRHSVIRFNSFFRKKRTG